MEIIINRKELKRSYIIKMAVDGKITVGQAASTLNLCTRRIKQLKASYKKNGDQIFIHGNKNKVSSKKSVIQFVKKSLLLEKRNPLLRETCGFNLMAGLKAVPTADL